MFLVWFKKFQVVNIFLPSAKSDLLNIYSDPKMSNARDQAMSPAL